MGACGFANVGKGRSAEEVFRLLVDDAAHEHGHGGYTGTIAEKSDFRNVPAPPEAWRRELLTTKIADLERVLAENEKRVALPGGAYWARNIESGKERIKEIKARLADPKPIPLAEIAYDYAEALDEKFDKWGPAGCLVLREPDPIKPLSKAKAEALAKERFGESAEIEVKRHGKRSSAFLYVVQKEPGHGVNTREVGGWRCAVRSFQGKDADEARGGLFAEPGEFLFFGSASS